MTAAATAEAAAAPTAAAPTAVAAPPAPAAVEITAAAAVAADSRLMTTDGDREQRADIRGETEGEGRERMLGEQERKMGITKA